MSTEPRKMLRLAEVCETVGLKHAAIYAKIKAKAFPAPVKIGYASRWIESEVQAWIDGHVAATRSGTEPK